MTKSDHSGPNGSKDGAKSFLKSLGQWPPPLTLRVVVWALFGCLYPYAHNLGIPPLLVESSGSPSSPPAPICEAMGQHESITLPDGSQLELDSGACITMEFGAKKRIVRLLSGEAIFQVARDPRRPFDVETGPISIVDIGTTFDVYRTELGTRVLVSEGAVQIPSGGTTSQPLTALQQMYIPDDTAQPRVRRHITHGDFDRMTAWVHGDIELDQQPLREAMTEFARYRHFRFEFADSSLAELRVGGEYRMTDVESFLGLLKQECIHSQYDKVAQRITFTSGAGKRVGCQ